MSGTGWQPPAWTRLRDEEATLGTQQASARYWRKQEERKEREARKAKSHILTLASALEDFIERSKHREKRLGLLRQMATVVIKDVSVNELQRKRTAFDALKQAMFPLDAAWCWLCDKKPAIERHHVLLLKHGGPELVRENVVLLCRDCHCAIHPWLYVTSLSDSELQRMISLVQDIKSGKVSRPQAEIELDHILDSLYTVE